MSQEGLRVLLDRDVAPYIRSGYQRIQSTFVQHHDTPVSQRPISRKGFLAASVLLALAACTPQKSRDPAPSDPQDRRTATARRTESRQRSETDEQIITRAAKEIQILDVDRDGETKWIQFPIPQGNTNAALIFMDGTRNPILKKSGESIQSFANPQGSIALDIHPSLPNHQLSMYFALRLGEKLSYIIGINDEEQRNRSNIDIALELILSTASIKKLQEQYEQLPEDRPAQQRLDSILQDREATIARNMYAYAQQARAVIYHAALVGDTNGITRQRINDAARFVEAGQDENSPKWRAFGENKLLTIQGQQRT